MAAILVVTSAGSTITDVSDDIEVVVVQAEEWTSSREREEAVIEMVVAIAACEGDKSVLEPAERPWLRPAGEAIDRLPAWWLRPLRMPSSYG